MNALPSWVTAALIAGTFAIMLALELRVPLRRVVEPKVKRIVRNLTIAALGATVLSLVQAPLVVVVAGWTSRHGVGLLNWAELPPWLGLAIAIVLLDYTLWHWHRLNHLVPLLWRFHLVHHVDRDLDASTALRFHFGELLLSVVFRLLQAVAIGMDPLLATIWETLVFVSILFHHSNTRLPIAAERVLVRIVVTPRMHGIHHSDRQAETNSNWSNLLSIWDYVHGTARLNVPQHRIVIGVPAFRDPGDVTIGEVLALPFRRRRSDWQDEREATSREPTAAPPTVLAE